MADDKKSPPVSPLKPSDGRPESPTTARPLDFDSDQEAGSTTPVTTSQSESGPKPPPKEDTPPPKPPRPLSARQQAENTLKEAFPTIDTSVIKAVLTASGGSVEPAFHALLGMTDPDAQKEPEPPAKPPRPTRPATSTQLSQLEADELYARQLHEHYSGAAARHEPPGSGNRYNENLRGSRVGRPGANPDPDDVHWRSFIDDDLPEIRDNIKKGFLETQQTVNRWISNFKKRIDGEDEDSDFTSPPPRPAQGYGGGAPGYGRRSGDTGRRSADIQRYDADPQVIGDDFSKLELRDGEAPPRTSSRPLANPNLFKPSPATGPKPSLGSGRKVSFQDGPPEEIQDLYSASPKPASTTTTSKASKWQPLSAVDPSPVAENDPFSLGDSDDEKDAKPIALKDDEGEGDLQKTIDATKKDSTGETGSKVSK